MSRTVLDVGRKRWRFALAFSSILGGTLFLSGTMLGFLSLLRLLHAYHRLENLGTVLIVVSFPLLGLAAHSLDKAHEAGKATRMESFEQTGMMSNEGK